MSLRRIQLSYFDLSLDSEGYSNALFDAFSSSELDEEPEYGEIEEEKTPKIIDHANLDNGVKGIRGQVLSKRSGDLEKRKGKQPKFPIKNVAPVEAEESGSGDGGAAAAAAAAAANAAGKTPSSF